MSKRFTYWIVGGMILGAVVGYILYTAIPDPKAAALVGGYFSIITDLFLRLIKMIIAPLVFSMLVVGIAHMGDTESIGRIGLKAMWPAPGFTDTEIRCHDGTGGVAWSADDIPESLRLRR
jgi:Na+/H+-dicarboxylate symporter